MVSRCTSGSVSPMFGISQPRQPSGAHLWRLPTALALSEQRDKRSTRERCSRTQPCTGATLRGKRIWDLYLMQSETKSDSHETHVLHCFATKTLNHEPPGPDHQMRGKVLLLKPSCERSPKLPQTDTFTCNSVVPITTMTK